MIVLDKTNNILVTGGCGFIGSNFIRYLINKRINTQERYKIINLDKLTYAGNVKNLDDIKDEPGYYFYKGDICNENLVNDILKDHLIDTIVNFAAESHVDKSNQKNSIDEFRRTNIFGTEVLLESAKANNVNKFLQISTDEVYGSIQEGSFRENSELNPSNPYSVSKAEAEEKVLLYKNDMQVLITRSSNNFGPYQYPEKFIPLMITNVLEGKKIPVYGDGKQVRDWLFVNDNCDAIYFVLNNGENGESYNITTKNEKENIWMVKKILELMHRENESEKLIQYVEDRVNHDKRYSIDNSKLLNLGWKINSDFECDLEETIEWYFNNIPWWTEIKQKSEFKKWYNEEYIKKRGLE